MRTVVRDVYPDACVHLGAISFVPDGAKDPGKLFSINVGGTVNLLSAFRKEVPAVRFLFVSTAQVYGCSSKKTDVRVTEESPTYPLSMYAISKCAGEQAVLSHGFYHNMDVLIARPGNHTGPGQTTRFLVASLVAQAKRIRAGNESCFVAGNLDGERDFTDVRDVVSAYRLMLERGCRGGKYNISSGDLVPLRHLLNMIQSAAGISAEVKVDPALVRATDYSRIMDTDCVRHELGWEPKYSLERTLKDMMED